MWDEMADRLDQKKKKEVMTLLKSNEYPLIEKIREALYCEKYKKYMILQEQIAREKYKNEIAESQEGHVKQLQIEKGEVSLLKMLRLDQQVLELVVDVLCNEDLRDRLVMMHRHEKGINNLRVVE